MTTTHHKKQNNKSLIGSVVAEMAGAAAVAAIMALKDEKTRKRVKKVLVNAKNQAIDYVEGLKTELNAGEKTHLVKKTMADTKTIVEKTMTGGEKHGIN
jgi:threonine dehydratase